MLVQLSRHSNDRNLQHTATLSSLFLADLTMPNRQVAPYHGRRTTERAAGPRLSPGSTFFELTKIRLVLRFFSLQTKTIDHIKKVTIPHMGITTVCRYSQCIAPKTPTTQPTVKLPMFSAVCLVNRK